MQSGKPAHSAALAISKAGREVHNRQAIARAFQIALQLEQKGDEEGAEKRYQQIVRTDPRHADALNRLGVIAANRREYGASAKYFSDAIKTEPKNAPLRGNLGAAYLKAHDLPSALIQLKKAVALDKHSPVALYHLADCLAQMEKPDEALDYIERLFKIAPDHARAKLLYARVKASLGDMEEAESVYRKMIADGKQLASAYAGIASIKKFKEEPPELAEMEKLLGSDDYKQKEKQTLHFGAGKIAADSGQHDRAFTHFIAGKACYEDEFDIIAYRDLVQGLIEITTPEFFAERRDFANKSDRPVLVFGMPRSGTTLTEQILGSHPLAKPAGEVLYFSQALRAFNFNRDSPYKYLRRLQTMSAKDARRLADGYLATLRKHSRTASRVVDKMPHNFEHVWIISLLFPNATFVHARRDPMDNCISCFTNPLNEAHNYTGSLKTLGRYYRLYSDLTEHWYKVCPVEIMASQYEELTADQDGRSRALVAHMGLEWDDACLKYYESDASVRTLSRWQVRQPVYQSSVARWKKYDAHLDPLKEALGDLYQDPDATA